MASEDQLEQLVSLSVSGNIANVALNRPKVNALDANMFRAIQHRYVQLKKDPSIRGIVLHSGAISYFHFITAYASLRRSILCWARRSVSMHP